MRAGATATAIITLLIAFSALPGNLYAQIPRTSITFAYGGILSGDTDIDHRELEVLENRITSQLLEVGKSENYSIINIDNRQSFLTGFPFGGNVLNFLDSRRNEIPPGARGIIVGQIHRIGQRIYVDLHIYSVSSGELLLATSADFSGMEETIADSRNMIFELFGVEPTAGTRGIAQGVERQAGSDVEWKRPSMSFLSGTWQGDTGIGSVTIQTDGTGFAELTGDDTMRIRVNIDGEEVRVRQDEPNAPKLYLSLFPYSIALQIVNLARPMSWEFHLSSDGQQLVGEKFTSYFYIEDGEISRVDNTYSRAATWIRMD